MEMTYTNGKTGKSFSFLIKQFLLTKNRINQLMCSYVQVYEDIYMLLVPTPSIPCKAFKILRLYD